ncbi:MAG: amidohydrolase family protein [Planctomycetes bacterium]|nr:amidohydrolase family protein [Planctomycetota bacterium]
MWLKRFSVLLVASGVGLSGPWEAGCLAQTAPVNGIRSAEVRAHAIVDATVVVAPGQEIPGATIVIRDGIIEAVGDDVAIPPDARIWSGEGLRVYPGLIDAALLIGADEPAAERGARHWNRRVHPEVRMAEEPGPDRSVREDLRKLGFTAAAVYPDSGVFRGSGVVIALADADEHLLSYRDRAAMAIGLDTSGSSTSGEYPVSAMGAVALVRQTLYDARWHADATRIWAAQPRGHEPPIRSAALEALASVIQGRQQTLFCVSDELSVLRAASISREFQLDAIILASGLEFRRLKEVAAAGHALIVPCRYPERPDVSSLSAADRVSLRQMMTWEQAPTNPRRLLAAGVTVALTTHRLEKRKDFPEALHRAILHGLSEDDALASLTTTPARLLGVADIMGTIEVGKVANLVTVEGTLFARKPKVRSTWVNGRRYEISRDPDVTFQGPGTLTTSSGAVLHVDVDTTKKRLRVYLPDGTKRKAKKVIVERDRVSAVLEGRLFDVEGYVRLQGVVTEGDIVGTGVMPDGGQFAFTITPGAPTPPTPEASKTQPPEASKTQPPPGATDPDQPAQIPARKTGPQAEAPTEPRPTEAEPPEAARDDPEADDEEQEQDQEAESEEIELPPEALPRPLGAYGLTEPPQPQTVAVIGATIWTAGAEGIITNGALLVADGTIAYVGPADGFEPPAEAIVIDGSGKHVTPGLIDCHSHTGISGGVNESTQAVTAEVRIGDVIDPDDINFYRQLAGGLTAANQLHGSANPIGGQNSVIKLKWARSAEEMVIDDAIGGIKFALGENVKRSQSRYPNSRMGVEAIIRDAFTAAGEYQARWQRYRSLDDEERALTRPPRRDLELDALVEILQGTRIVHCHSYRQDEILMLVRLAEEFGFTIGTFQHVLEGYKVADAIAAHGAGASTFSDWWAYKIEVMDAIPFNGALMNRVGVLVSFNSDSSELARRLNTEAAKAVRYGGLNPHDALKFVTINPATQLRIDHRTGSLMTGKDADFVIWSESPLSTYARCEQTWIEGARYFDLDDDRDRRQWAASERQRLVQKILKAAHDKPKDAEDAATPGGSRREHSPDEPEP